MTDRELRREFVRVEKTQDEVQILVHEIRWQGPHTPIRTWVVGQSLPAAAYESEIENATASILRDDRYFRACLNVANGSHSAGCRTKASVRDALWPITDG